jgi:hypothetical protein
MPSLMEYTVLLYRASTDSLLTLNCMAPSDKFDYPGSTEEEVKKYEDFYIGWKLVRICTPKHLFNVEKLK